jgi:hypothetical protein
VSAHVYGSAEPLKRGNGATTEDAVIYLILSSKKNFVT